MAEARDDPETMPALVDAGWLAARLDDADVRVLDCTVWLRPDPSGVGQTAESGRAGWRAAHIPGGDFADLLEDLSDPASPLRFALPSARRFAEAMGELGVGDGARVVLYDRDQMVWAARLWWMLRAFGFDRAAVLDGGFAAWTAAGLPQSDQPCRYPPARFTARPRPELFTDRAGVQAALGQNGTLVLNALRREQHAGTGGVHYGRPGHIPGSVCVPARTLTDPATGQLRPRVDLRAEFAAAGALQAARVVAYCGSGIAACGDAFVLHLLGAREVAVYGASLQEWAADPAVPMERD